MSSHVFLRFHYVWSTKNRIPQIAPEWQERLYAYIGGTLKARNATLIEAGGVEDHIHLYVSMPTTLTVAQAVNLMKSNSSGWVHREIGLKRFAWQVKYGAFSVSKSAEADLIAYIKNQKEHHQKWSFEDELRELLRKHGVDFDERYFLE